MPLSKEEIRKRLKLMLAQVAPDQKLENIVPPKVEAPAVPMGAFEMIAPGPSMEVGLDKLQSGHEEAVDDQELYSLEAIVMPKYRPVVFVRGASYDDVDAPWTGVLNAADVKSRIAALFPSIGRIELPNSFTAPYAGTGFVVGKGLLMTNRHVAQLFSTGLGTRVVYRAGGSAVDFKRQVDTPGGDRSAYLKVTGVELIHPYWDMALLHVEGLPAEKPLDLSVAAPQTLFGKNVVAIGYPAPDARSDILLQNQIFQGQFYVKRLQPGTIRERAPIQSFEHQVSALTHDCSTLGGNSGSCIVDVATCKVVALHFAGEYLRANYSVPMWELARDPRLKDVHLSFDGAVDPSNDWEPAWQAADREEQTQQAQQPAPQPGASVADLTAAPAPAPAPSRGAAAAVPVASFTIPLHISIWAGQAVPSTAAAAEPSTTPAAEIEKVIVDQDYSDRPGYDPDFLEDIRVPLPKISSAMERITAKVHPDACKNDDPYELTYYHYSVYMNSKRRTAWFSAANVDGKQRPKIGPREGDRWYTDTRILTSAQLNQAAFEHGIDRGHLTRRDDTAWGRNVREATLANNDTFHFTNCSLQVSGFNRGKDRWQGLEQFLLEKHAKKDKQRMIVITGPVFASTDPAYQNDSMNYAVQFPLNFWKVCVLVREDGGPAATGFLLGQPDARDLPGVEAFDVGAAQVTMEDLEQKTGLDFGALRKYDHFAQGGAPATIESPLETTAAGRPFRRIRTGADIVV